MISLTNSLRILFFSMFTFHLNSNLAQKKTSDSMNLPADQSRLFRWTNLIEKLVLCLRRSRRVLVLYEVCLLLISLSQNINENTMILTELSDEIFVDESITSRSPATYFITHLYCNETICFPPDWNELKESYVYTTEYIARILSAYLNVSNRFRILDTVKPMNIVLSDKTHCTVTTFVGSGANRNCALLFECEYGNFGCRSRAEQYL